MWRNRFGRGFGPVVWQITDDVDDDDDDDIYGKVCLRHHDLFKVDVLESLWLRHWSQSILVSLILSQKLFLTKHLSLHRKPWNVLASHVLPCWQHMIVRDFHENLIAVEVTDSGKKNYPNAHNSVMLFSSYHSLFPTETSSVVTIRRTATSPVLPHASSTWHSPDSLHSTVSVAVIERNRQRIENDRLII